MKRWKRSPYDYDEHEVWRRERLAELAAKEDQLRHFHFLLDVLEIFWEADVRSELIWNFAQDRGGRLELWADTSDVFAWGASDCEEITPERLPLLHRAFEDLKPYGSEGLMYLPELYAARIRRMRPQGAAYPQEGPVVALLDACGPEREIDVSNPREQPKEQG